jgi:hypothetical protein
VHLGWTRTCLEDTDVPSNGPDRPMCAKPHVLHEQLNSLCQDVGGSLANLERCRAAIAADPDFKEFPDATDGMIVAQEDRALRRVNFKSLS